ncbi:MAG: helical backbone metal receptor [Methanothrix sp.]
MKLVNWLIILALLVIPVFAEESRTIVLTDEDGRSVTVPLNPESIVCLSPGAAEVLCALDAQDKIVAVTKDCNIPASLQEKECIGVSGREADIERILELKPDLVIAKTGSLFAKYDEEKLTDYGIPVLRYRVLHIDTLLPMIEDLGKLLEKKEQADEMNGWIDEYYHIVLDRTGMLPDSKKPSVYFMSMGHMDWTGNRASTGNTRIAEAGGRNIAADLPVTVPHVETEWIIEQNPEVMIYSMSTEQRKGTYPTIEEMKAKQEEIMSQPGFEGIDAVKTGRVYIADINMANGLSEMVTMLYYAKWLHPDLFQDIDPRSVHAELLQKYAHMDIKDIRQVYPEDPVEVPAASKSLSTTTDGNGSFVFNNLPAGTYVVTAYKSVMGTYPYLGNATVGLTGDTDGINITLKSSHDDALARFENTTTDLGESGGKYSLSGKVLGPNRPGGEPSVIPYEDAEVKLTEYFFISQPLLFHPPNRDTPL